MNVLAGANADGVSTVSSAGRPDGRPARLMRVAGIALVLGLVLLAYHLIARTEWSTLVAQSWKWPAILLFRTQTTAAAIVACIALVDRGAADWTGRRLHYVAAVLAGNVIAGVAALALLEWTDLPYGGPSRPRWVLFIQLEYLLLSGGMVFVLVDRARARAAQARLHAVQRRRLEVAKRTLEARLQAMQARVEPHFLFDTLGCVRRLHANDRERAGRLLDELIAYLRAAMPPARDTSSSVGQEVALVRAWLAIVRSAADCRVDDCIDVAPEALGARLPPMLLLPLVRCVLGGVARPAGRQRYLRLAATAERSMLELRIASGGWTAGPGTDDILANLRERLAALYGTAASLAFTATPQGDVETVLRIPFETSHPHGEA